jgi:hypothetical protein
LVAGWAGAADRKAECYREKNWYRIRKEQYEQYVVENNIKPLTVEDVPQYLPRAFLTGRVEQEEDFQIPDIEKFVNPPEKENHHHSAHHNEEHH